jgi:hypothetical protein
MGFHLTILLWYSSILSFPHLLPQLEDRAYQRLKTLQIYLFISPDSSSAKAEQPDNAREAYKPQAMRNPLISMR